MKKRKKKGVFAKLFRRNKGKKYGFHAKTWMGESGVRDFIRLLESGKKKKKGKR